MPLPLTVSCFSKIQIGFSFLVPAHLGSPGERAVKRVCVCVLYVCIEYWIDAVVSGQEKDQAKQIFTSSAASGILTNDLVKILQDEKVRWF